MRFFIKYFGGKDNVLATLTERAIAIIENFINHIINDTIVCGYCKKDQGIKKDFTLSRSCYPTGTCPKECISCNETICPQCGGKLEKENSCDEVRDYCGDDCIDCNYEHCGGCI